MEGQEPCVAYRSILNSLSEGVCAVDMACRITCFNREAERLLGQAADAAIGALLWTIPLFDEDAWREAIRAVMKPGGTRRQVRSDFNGGEGESIPVTVTISPLEDAQGRLAAAR